eukprot:2164454-Prymnesium_polylepis.1
MGIECARCRTRRNRRCPAHSRACTRNRRGKTHEPVENLTAVSHVAVGDVVFFKSDGPEFYGT